MQLLLNWCNALNRIAVHSWLALRTKWRKTLAKKYRPNCQRLFSNLLNCMQLIHAWNHLQICFGFVFKDDTYIFGEFLILLWNLFNFLQFTTISETDIHQLQLKLEENLAHIRPNAVGIVDGFDIPDNILCSALGSYDGNVYERLYAEAQKSPLNKASDNKAFHLYLKPFLKSNL